MKWLSAVLAFVNLSVVCGLLLGMAGRGLNTLTAALALVCGVAFAVAAYLGTSDQAVRTKTAKQPAVEPKPRNHPEPHDTQNTGISSALTRYRRFWFWAV